MPIICAAATSCACPTERDVRACIWSRMVHVRGESQVGSGHDLRCGQSRGAEIDAHGAVFRSNAAQHPLGVRGFEERQVRAHVSVVPTRRSCAGHPSMVQEHVHMQAKCTLHTVPLRWCLLPSGADARAPSLLPHRSVPRRSTDHIPRQLPVRRPGGHPETERERARAMHRAAQLVSSAVGPRGLLEHTARLLRPRRPPLLVQPLHSPGG